MSQITITHTPKHLTENTYHDVYEFFHAAVASGDIVEFSEASLEEVPDNVFEAYKKSLKSDPKTYTNI